MQCISDDQVKRSCLISFYGILLAFVTGGIFGFSLCLLINPALEDRMVLGVGMLSLCPCMIAILLFGMYIFNIPQPETSITF